MKNIKNKLLGLLIMILGCLAMAGCAGGTITTELRINPDGSGSRVMNVAIDNGYFSDDFNGTYEDLDAVIKENIPDDMSYSLNSVDGSDSEYQAEFIIEFTDVDDYNDKIYNITENEDYYADIVVPTSEWATGIKVDEEFTSANLFAWLKTALLDGGYVTSDNESYIIEDGTSSLVFGDPVTTGNYIYQNTLSYVRLDSIDVLTEITDIGEYNKTLVFYVTLSSIADKADVIEEFFTSRAPEGATVSVAESDYYMEYSVSMENLTNDTMATLSSPFFNAYDLEILDVSADGYFDFKSGIYNSFDASNYIFDDWSSIYITEYVKGDNTIKSGSEEYVWFTDDYYTSDKHPGYVYVDSDDSNGENIAELEYYYSKNYRPSSLEMYTDVGKKDFTHTMCVKFGNEVPEDRGAVIVERIENKLSNVSLAEDTKWSVNFADKSVLISVKGEAGEVITAMQAITGGTTTVAFDAGDSLVKLKVPFYYYEFEDFYSFVSDKTDDFVVSYKADLPGGTKIENCDESSAVVEKRSVNFLDKDTFASYTVTGTMWNTKGIIFWIVVVVIIAAGTIVTLMLTCSKQAKEKRAAKKQAMYAQQQAIAQQRAQQAAQAQPQPVAQQPVQEQPVVQEQPQPVEQPVQEEQPVVQEQPQVAPPVQNEEAEAPNAETLAPEAVAEAEAPAPETAPVEETPAPAEAPAPASAPQAPGGFCTKCGNPRNGAMFCTKCGNKF